MNPSDEDESANPQKRRRVPKARNRCRQGKLKCNGAIPQSGTCLKAKKTCSYKPTMKKRGLRTGYVRALECLWGLVIQSIDGSESAVEKLIVNTSRKSSWVRDDLRDGPKGVEAPLETWKASRIPQAIDALLSANEDMDDDDLTTVLLNPPDQTKEIGFTWSVPDQSPSDHLSGYDGSVPVTNGGALDQNQMEAKAPTTSNKTNKNELPELPQNTQKLLNRYFALTHNWLPIVERHAVYRSLFAYRKTSAVDSADNWKSGENAVLWAIFAYATMIYDPPGTGHDPTQNPTLSLDELYMSARNIIPLEKEDNYSIGHVQTLLILGLLHYSSCQWSVARTVMGQAIILASHIGLDQIDNYQTDHHRRTWLGGFVLDTLTSANTGKPPQIRSHQVHTFLPIDEAGNEEWEPWHLQEALLPGVGTEMAEFGKLLELLCITNDWMCSTTSELNDGCKQALKIWDERLPAHIRTIFGVDAFSTASISPPANILNLYMIHAFLCTKLTCSTSTRLLMGLNPGQEWQTLINGMDRFFGRFDQRSIPASFNLLRNILPQKVTGKSAFCELIAELKKELCGYELTQQCHPQAIVEN
ncbi:Fc.00g011120.m01.CDS01 [Cosmosporella sp. VM-42]